MAHTPLNVLFVCERNSTRSIMAEALLNRFGGGRFKAYSAGIEPASEVHPLTLEVAHAGGIRLDHLRPKSLRDFTSPTAPRMDFVITMGKPSMAALAGLPGNPIRAQWGISDPVATEGDLNAQRFGFRRAWRELETRIKLFVLLRHRRGDEGVPQRQSA